MGPAGPAGPAGVPGVISPAIVSFTLYINLCDRVTGGVVLFDNGASLPIQIERLNTCC